MKLARRALDMEPFHALAFGQKAADLEAKGHRIIKLSIGEPDFGAPKAVSDAMRSTMTSGQPLPYTPALGLPELRQAITEFYRVKHGVQFPPDRVAITAGASAALLLALAATTDPGDEVIMADPSYPCNRELVTTFGGKVVLAPTSVESRYQLDAKTLAEAWSERTSSVMVASPSNPTGTSIPQNELATICDFARNHGGWRIVDEIYLDLADEVAGKPAQSVLVSDPDAIVISSFSKYFGMTGWRLGWAILPEELVEAVERMSMNYFLCASAPIQRAALAAFSPEAIAECEHRRRELQERRAIVLEALAEIGLSVPVVPDGAFYIYMDVSNTGLDAWTFCERLLAEAHVSLTPGRDFAAATADTHVRLSYAAAREDLVEGCRRLGEFVHSLEA